MSTQTLSRPTKEQQKEWSKKREYDNESMPQVVKLWQEVNELKKELSKTYEDMPMSMDLNTFNRNQNYNKMLLDDKMEFIEFLEHITDVQGITYKSPN